MPAGDDLLYSFGYVHLAKYILNGRELKQKPGTKPMGKRPGNFTDRAAAADEIKGLIPVTGSDRTGDCRGFCLAELLLAFGLLTFGLLAVGQLLAVTAALGCLDRSKGTAAIAARSTMESLSDLYRRNPSDGAFAPGVHGPRTIGIRDPWSGAALNLYRITWETDAVGDPRPGMHVRARRVTVHVVPIGEGGEVNIRPMFNQSLDLTTVFGPGTP